MSLPRVFISSTIYDLRHVRNAIKEFVEYIGFEPVLSEDNDVFYKSGKSAQEACLDEIKRCDLYVLLIGSRYGELFRDESISITHREYREALKEKLPIFAFVDLYVRNSYGLYAQNPSITGVKYPHVQDTEVFDLISEVENRRTDNTLISFDMINDIIDYLRKQFARMFKEKLPHE